jgi:hypothetical protein
LIVPIQGIQRKPSLLPIRLKHFGMNPYRKPLYRVVWGPSRDYIVGGMWEDRDEKTPSTNTEIMLNGKDTSVDRRVAEYRWIQKYPSPRWVLEKWLTAVEYGGSLHSWNVSQFDEESGLLVLGPWPEKGEYEECYIFPEGEPPASAVESVIQMIEAGRKYSYQENKDAHLRALHQQKKEQLDRMEDIWLDSQDAFNNLPSSVRPGKRTADDVRFDHILPDTGSDDLKFKFFQGKGTVCP